MGSFVICYVWLHCYLEKKIITEGQVMIGSSTYRAIEIEEEGEIDCSVPEVILEAEKKNSIEGKNNG